jgi:uncharacterized damage-inducible protein DinB
MENNVLINSLKKQFFFPFSMLEKITEICPDELWNKKVSGYIFWQQLLHTFTGEHFWLRQENSEFIEPFKDKNVYPEMEKEPENILTKEVLRNFCNETKEIAEKWFNGKDDDWLKLSSKIYNKLTNLDVVIMQIGHMMYHIGHFDAIFRERGIEPLWQKDEE